MSMLPHTRNVALQPEGGCSDTSFPLKKSSPPSTPTLGESTTASGQLLGRMHQMSPIWDKMLSRGALDQQLTHPTLGEPLALCNCSQATGKLGRPFRARVRRRKKVYMPRRHMEERK